MDITVQDFSGVYGSQPFMQELRGHARYMDCAGIPGTDCYCDDEAVEAIRGQIAKAGINSAEGIHFFDNGNYHYMSKIWTDMVQEPFSLVIFDHHPDMQAPKFGGILSCGGWVLAAREGLPLLKADYLNTADIPGGLPVYLSIDLDVMPPQFARTDWSQGVHSLEQVLEILQAVFSQTEVVAVDVCGGITPEKGGTPEDLRINKETDEALFRFLSARN